MQLKRKKLCGNEKDTLKINESGQVVYLAFPSLDALGMARHLFSTRIGGVSEGIYSSMNLSYTRGDKKENVDENFRRIARALGTVPENIVCSRQTHTTNIRLVTKGDMGKGVVRPMDYDDVDGLITDIPEIALCTLYADCVPLYFIDKKNRAIGLAHSGWRGTVKRMGAVMAKAMRDAFGTKPEDIFAAIGPSICQECYEVSEDVAEAFRESFPHEWEQLLKAGKEQGKYRLDLWEANRRVLINAGIPEKNIAVTDVCTCCNSDLLFSHRASLGRRGNLAAFLMLN